MDGFVGYAHIFFVSFAFRSKRAARNDLNPSYKVCTLDTRGNERIPKQRSLHVGIEGDAGSI